MNTPLRKEVGPMEHQRVAASHTRIMVGTPPGVASRVLGARMSGALLGWSEVRELADGPGRVAVKVRLAGPAPAAQSAVVVPADASVVLAKARAAVAPKPVRSSRVRLYVAAAAVALGVFAFAAYLAYLAVAAAVAWVAANAYGLTSAGLAAAVLVWLAVRSGAACQGFHCPGCSHR